ncbi:hypothetical protein E4U43_003111 [Claviceps pusilla]|uniref:Uncharacterized protein n=1 Tax=Claviceps pusilla TaxID=123648 RepID=A0A9P7N5L5_9HYPO|nr:hypothetical protein E4U43_003111 [Claviceps pusilla]
MATSRTISASTQNRILIWRSEVASAVDDAASSAASYSGHTSSLSDAHSSTGYSSSQARSGGAMIARGRRLWNRLARRLSRGRFGGLDEDLFLREPAMRTAMYRAPPPPPPSPPVDARGVLAPRNQRVMSRDLGLDMNMNMDIADERSSSDTNPRNAARKGLEAKQKRLERAARLLDHH